MLPVKHVDFYYDFSCPYAYLASCRVEAIARAHGATLALCPMLLGGVFRAIGTGDGPMKTLGPAKLAHNAADMHRWAARLGVPFRVPAGHPMRTVQALRVLLGLPREVWSDAMHALYAAYWQRGEDIARDEVIETALAETKSLSACCDPVARSANCSACCTKIWHATPD